MKLGVKPDTTCHPNNVVALDRAEFSAEDIARMAAMPGTVTGLKRELLFYKRLAAALAARSGYYVEIPDSEWDAFSDVELSIVDWPGKRMKIVQVKGEKDGQGGR